MFTFLKGRQMFNFGLEQSARLARADKDGLFILPAMRILGMVNGTVRKLRKQDSVSDIAGEWQRMFPGADKNFPIVKDDGRTAVAEIRVKCPLRDSGDVHACYRMMEYDRKMVSDMGGQFIVLESQSNNGKGICRVAFRQKGEDMSDLVPAHERL